MKHPFKLNNKSMGRKTRNTLVDQFNHNKFVLFMNCIT